MKRVLSLAVWLGLAVSPIAAQEMNQVEREAMYYRYLGFAS